MYLVFFQILFPYRSSQSIELSFQCYILHPCRLSILYVVAVQSLSHVRLFVIPWTAASQAFLSFTVSQSLLKLMSTESVMPSNHLIFCCPVLLLPSIFPSIKVFSNELALCTRWPKYWSFSISLSSEYYTCSHVYMMSFLPHPTSFEFSPSQDYLSSNGCALFHTQLQKENLEIFVQEQFRHCL